MSMAEKYRETARRMRARAAAAATPEERAQYRQLSIAWEELAAEAERQAAKSRP
jgi:hypothetical protein